MEISRKYMHKTRINTALLTPGTIKIPDKMLSTIAIIEFVS